MRRMAARTLAVGRRVVLERSLADLLLQVVMALQAQLAPGFDQELLVLGLVRVVARCALAVRSGLVLHSCRGNLLSDFLVALGTEFPVGLRQQLLVRRGMR